MEKVEKEKEAPNLSLSCPKVNDQSLKVCPPKRSRGKVRNDQSVCIMEILTEPATKKGTNEDKKRKSVNAPTGSR